VKIRSVQTAQLLGRFDVAVAVFQAGFGFVDPYLARRPLGDRSTAWEALGMSSMCVVENGLALDDALVNAVEVNIGWREHCDAAVVMLVVVPVEEVGAETARVFDFAEAIGEAGPVLECLEV
jgi:hypothetical protein